MSVLKLTDVSLAYQDQPVVDGISITLNDGEIACLLGPSGCGKTTLLRAIAGFKTLDNGVIEFAGKLISTKSFTEVPEKREMGMVFQDFALFPHLNVEDNICFGIRHFNKKNKVQRLSALLNLIGLSGSGKKFPHELSGGQQQRVALARAIAPKPKLLLLDEPFSSMDIELRASLAKEIRTILKHEKVTAVMVTHDQHEAFNMADRIGVMSQGKLLQWGSAEDLYHSPADFFVASFVGSSNFLKGAIRGEYVSTALGDFIYNRQSIANGVSFEDGEQVRMLVRPEFIQQCDTSGRRATLISKEFRGGSYLYYAALDSGEEIKAMLPSQENYKLGQAIGITLSTDKVSIFKID